MNISNENTQLWKEEPERLVSYAETVPENGTIVEIGTATGGTARLLYEATKDKKIQIYTIDIDPSPKAFEVLKETNVIIIKDDSCQQGKRWALKNLPIDLLFIDGDHSFEGIYKDYKTWHSYLTDESQVVFHDVDQPDRGGIAHLGVRIFIDTMISKGALKDTAHEYRFLKGKKGDFDFSCLTIKDFFHTFAKIKEDSRILIKKLCDNSLDYCMSVLKEKNKITSLDACYITEHLLANNKHYVMKHSFCTAETLRHAEMAWMHEHAYGTSYLPGICPENIAELSKLIAAEHLVCNLYKNILQTLVEWTP